MAEMRDLIARHLSVGDGGSIVGEFSLESGGEALRGHFARVEVLRPPPDPLYVTEAEPLVEYVRSMGSFVEGSDQAWGALEREVRAEIDKAGHFLVTRETGVFPLPGVTVWP